MPVRRSIVPERTWPFQSPENRRRGTWRHVTTPRAHVYVCVCVRACAHNGVNLPERERGRGSRVARVTYCRARFTRDALDKFLVPFELSDSSRSRTIRVIIPLLSSVSNRENFVQNVNRSLNVLFYFRGNFRRVRFEWIGINFSFKILILFLDLILDPKACHEYILFNCSKRWIRD